MSRLLNMARRLRRDARGTTVIEFAVVCPIAMMTVIALADLGYQIYATSTLAGEVQKAARDTTLEGSDDRLEAIDDKVREAVRRIAKDGTFEITRQSYTTFSDVGREERYTDIDGDNEYDEGECFEDENANGQWDPDVGRDGVGGPDDVVLYNVKVTYPRIFPMASLLGWSETQMIEATTTLKNQPYGEQEVPEVEGCE